MVSISEGTIMAVGSGVGGILWWGVRRIVTAFDTLGTNVEVIKDTTSDQKASIGILQSTFMNHEKLDEDRHEEKLRRFEQLDTVVAKIQEGLS